MMNDSKKYIEPVILVDDTNTPIGLCEKATVHYANTPLHRGFSIFLFNDAGEVLLQQRSLIKITWPGVWSNTCCGHPLPDESIYDAAIRRLQYELGITVAAQDITMVFPDYRYKAEREGVVENEFCPVMIVRHNSQPKINDTEVMATQWLHWTEFLSDTHSFNNFTPWCQEEARLLSKDAKFNSFIIK